MNKDQARTAALDRILCGRLPRRQEHALFAGRGDEAVCACCDEPITQTQVQYDVEPHVASGDFPFAVHLECYDAWAITSELIARAIASNHLTDTIIAAPAAGKRLFLIGYDYELLVNRATLLRAQGHVLSTALRNEAARAALGATPCRYDLFVLGPEAPQNVRSEMVEWLRRRYPHTCVLALNADEHSRLEGLKYNANHCLPDVWLPMVAAAALDCRA